MTTLTSAVDPKSVDFGANRDAMLAKLAEIEGEHAKAVAGGGEKYVERHRKRGKLLARERIELLLDPDSPFLELSPLAAWGSDYQVGASMVTGIGVVEGVECLVSASDPTVRRAMPDQLDGAMFRGRGTFPSVRTKVRRVR